MRTAVSAGWFDWPSLPDLFPVSFPGVQTKRDSFLIDIDINRLRERIDDYFDATFSHDEIERRYPAAMKSSSGFVVRDARSVRDALLARGGPNEAGFVRYAYRPFDNRWLYWEAGNTACLVVQYPTIGRMCSRGMCGWFRNRNPAANGRLHK